MCLPAPRPTYLFGELQMSNGLSSSRRRRLLADETPRGKFFRAPARTGLRRGRERGRFDPPVGSHFGCERLGDQIDEEATVAGPAVASNFVVGFFFVGDLDRGAGAAV